MLYYISGKCSLGYYTNDTLGIEFSNERLGTFHGSSSSERLTSKAQVYGSVFFISGSIRRTTIKARNSKNKTSSAGYSIGPEIGFEVAVKNGFFEGIDGISYRTFS